MSSKSEQPNLLVKDAEGWSKWLHKNEYTSDGVWLTLSKAGSTEPTSLKYADALEIAICSGWIDGQRKSVDAVTFTQRFTPRRKGSLWSLRNVQLVEKLTSEQLMRERGFEEVTKAKLDGRWSRAYPGLSSYSTPDDLKEALASNRQALTSYQALSPRERYSLVLPMLTARTDDARTKRIAAILATLQE